MGMELEVFPAQFCRAIRSHWRRRNYHRLESTAGKKKPARVTRLGDGAARPNRRRFWRLKRALRLRLKAWSPTRILARIRDAYVEAMLRLAGKGAGLAIPAGPQPIWDRRIPTARKAKIHRSEFEQRLFFEIYRSLVVSGEIAAA